MTTPSMGIRLATVARALEQVIIPALPPEEVLAREQATLAIVHLTTMAEQYRYMAEYELGSLADMSALANDLLAATEGGPVTTAAAKALRQIQDEVSTSTSPSTAHERRNTIAGGIDALVRASAEDGHLSSRTMQHRLIVDHGSRQATRDRAWFRGHGTDPDAATLPSIPELISSATR
ncbi:hypothetical protein ACH47B_27220 [Rhodococcus sp. NPDC019627]|uniref:hypothetical protein n=1 Tax=unclassified Rhodococcus (in: high G+C Gram-positive bacteria) TaxID=192944 RepID=UPI00340D972C